MTINISILNATGKLGNHIDCIEREIEQTLTKVKKYFKLENIDITVSPFQKGEESPSGIGGFAFNSHRVEILLDCSRDDINSVIENELLDVLSHEIHHALRLRFDTPSATLGEQLIMEGLACHFEHTITNGKASSLFKDLQDYDWQESLKKMTSLLSESDFSVKKFFLGSPPEEFPKYAGYWVGFNLVENYIQNCQVTDTDIVGLDSDVFFGVLS